MHKKLSSLAIFTCALLTACSSQTPRDATGPSAVTGLEKGYCPNSIVDRQGKDGQGRLRYGKSVNAGTLSALRAREIKNCNARVASGDTDALTTLVSHYDGSGQKAALVYTLENYAAGGTDERKLLDTGAYLYRAYAMGSADVPRNSDKAFKYLGLSVNNGNQSLKLNYAMELSRRGLNSDAMRYFQSIADNRSHTIEERCQARLSLGALYFGGHPADENWNIGYYYWRQGLALAKNPEWASCSEDNFTSPWYSDEAARKKFAEQRIALMSAAQLQVIDEARRDPAKGYDFIAALSFQRPAGAPLTAAVPPRQRANSYIPGWQPWAPIEAPICSMRHSAYQQSWNSVFEINASSIWTVASRNGSSQSQGSAVAVSPRELITNCHLIENPGQVSLRRIGQSIPARLKAADRRGDRCVLEVNSNLPSHVTLSRTYQSMKVGEDVAAIGNPKGLDTSLSRGIVAQKRNREGLNLIQTDAAISSGSSGGGLFDHAGNLVGITTFTVAEGQSLNFAIAIDEFCR